MRRGPTVRQLQDAAAKSPAQVSRKDADAALASLAQICHQGAAPGPLLQALHKVHGRVQDELRLAGETESGLWVTLARHRAVDVRRLRRDTRRLRRELQRLRKRVDKARQQAVLRSAGCSSTSEGRGSVGALSAAAGSVGPVAPVVGTAAEPDRDFDSASDAREVVKLQATLDEMQAAYTTACSELSRVRANKRSLEATLQRLDHGELVTRAEVRAGQFQAHAAQLEEKKAASEAAHLTEAHLSALDGLDEVEKEVKQVQGQVERMREAADDFRRAHTPVPSKRVGEEADMAATRRRRASVASLANTGEPAVGEAAEERVGVGEFDSASGPSISVLARLWRAQRDGDSTPRPRQRRDSVRVTTAGIVDALVVKLESERKGKEIMDVTMLREQVESFTARVQEMGVTLGHISPACSLWQGYRRLVKPKPGASSAADGTAAELAMGGWTRMDDAARGTQQRDDDQGAPRAPVDTHGILTSAPVPVQGWGTSDDVPCFLRTAESLQVRVLSKLEVEQLMMDVLRTRTLTVGGRDLRSGGWLSSHPFAPRRGPRTGRCRWRSSSTSTLCTCATRPRRPSPWATRCV